MLYNYIYQKHAIEKLHDYIEHTVLEVWCKPKGKFAYTKLHKDFQPIVLAVSKNKNDYLLKPIEAIYEICRGLGGAKLKILANGYKCNNAIEELCAGKLTPLLFKDLAAINVDLANLLNLFGKNLYDYVLDLKPVHVNGAPIDTHYDDFMQLNKIGKCPFCGLIDIKGKDHSKREAYDHYLSKDKYPFTSVNFKNLVPACSECNSSYKLQQDMLHGTNGKRRKAFFPFDKKSHSLNISVRFKGQNKSVPLANDIVITVECDKKQEEAKGWMEVYGIHERYKAKCASPEALYWRQQCIFEAQNYGISAVRHIDARKINRLYDYNFLRVPFLEECQRKNLL